MTPFTTHTGIAAAMPLVNIESDMIFPQQFLKTIQRSAACRSDGAAYRAVGLAPGSAKPSF
jgi:3-isopropylmalate/(R)-2-methylmalate dehydratase small subunit